MQNAFDDFDTTITAEEYYETQMDLMEMEREMKAWEDEMKFLDALDNYPEIE